eukprot:COSAG05_NODE_21691_length_270_cov_0.596491_1_plen_56_part_01
MGVEITRLAAQCARQPQDFDPAATKVLHMRLNPVTKALKAKALAEAREQLLAEGNQ